MFKILKKKADFYLLHSHSNQMPPKFNLDVLCVLEQSRQPWVHVLAPEWRPDLVFGRHDDVLWSCGGFVHLDRQRVCLAPRVAVRGEEAVVLLHAHRGPGQLASSKVHRQRSPWRHHHTPQTTSEDTLAHTSFYFHRTFTDSTKGAGHAGWQVIHYGVNLRIKESLIVQHSADETGCES